MGIMCFYFPKLSFDKSAVRKMKTWRTKTCVHISLENGVKTPIQNFALKDTFLKSKINHLKRESLSLLLQTLKSMKPTTARCLV